MAWWLCNPPRVLLGRKADAEKSFCGALLQTSGKLPQEVERSEQEGLLCSAGVVPLPPSQLLFGLQLGNA